MTFNKVQYQTLTRAGIHLQSFVSTMVSSKLCEIFPVFFM